MACYFVQWQQSDKANLREKMSTEVIITKAYENSNYPVWPLTAVAEPAKWYFCICSNTRFILTFINNFPEKAKQAQIRNQTVNQQVPDLKYL